ncbi:hypothetical protein NADE_005893 [Nannochloris sp. 'desiccata']|nr:hypothetical protein NADE_005893 [Chlorella desiccata (nom. nud.)]
MWQKLHADGRSVLRLKQISDGVELELWKVIEMAAAGYLEDPYPESCIVLISRGGYTLDMVLWRRKPSQRTTQFIVGMKVGVELSQKLVDYRTLLTARANIGGNCKEYPTFYQMPLLLHQCRRCGSLPLRISLKKMLRQQQ